MAAKVQDASGTANILGNPVVVTLGADPTPGNLLIGVACNRGSNVATPPTGWTEIATALTPSFDGGRVTMFYKIADAGDTDTVTFSIGGAHTKAAYVAEWEDAGTIETAATLEDQPATLVMSIGPYDPAASSGVLFAAFAQSARLPVITVDAPFTEEWDVDVDASGPSVVFGSLVGDPFSGAYTAEATSDKSEGYAAIIVAFGESGGGEPPGGTGGGAGPAEPAKAVLEIYVHDEDASRWGVATWADGPATGTEGIWSGAGWQDVTPQGLWAHIIWGSRRPDRGILSEQDGATWAVQTYDPDRKLDPGNPSSPYAPQLVAGVPIRVSHEGLVIRTGYIDRLAYRHRAPHYRGVIAATDTIALLHRAEVPDDSILSDFLLSRIEDVIDAAGIAVGGIPVPPTFAAAGPAVSPRIEGFASVWEHIRKGAAEVFWQVFVTNTGGINARPWAIPLDRSREITGALLEDLEAVTSEDGVYSVARVQPYPDTDPMIEREASPLPRYGRRTIERRETTIDPEGWAEQVLAERAWPGTQYVPGAIHPLTAADVNMLGSIEIMERLRLTVPGVVSVTGRVLGGELWVEHKANEDRGAKWIFRFAIATEGASAIGLTTLVADGTGDLIVDDATETDYLEAD